MTVIIEIHTQNACQIKKKIRNIIKDSEESYDQGSSNADFEPAKKYCYNINGREYELYDGSKAMLNDQQASMIISTFIAPL